MHYTVEGYLLRKPEAKDVEPLYGQKNDPECGALLGGFTTGYSRADLAQWVEFHRGRKDEVLWVIAAPDDDRALGHVGLYQIDHRVRKAEFAILLGAKELWGRGLGTAFTRFMVEYGFAQLNLHRVSLEVLATNERAQHIYRTLGFVEEGRLRQAQFKDGRYVDIVAMAVLRDEWARAHGL